MRKLIVSEFVTLDGVMEAPGGEEGHPHSGWVFDFMGPEQEQYKLDEVLASEALLLGRVTYEGFSAAWPARSGEFADKMNSMPKFAPPQHWGRSNGRTQSSFKAMSPKRSRSSGSRTAARSSWQAVARSSTR